MCHDHMKVLIIAPDKSCEQDKPMMVVDHLSYLAYLVVGKTMAGSNNDNDSSMSQLTK